MAVNQLDRIGEFMTLREAARVKGSTPNALYRWLCSKNIPHSKVGRAIVVRFSDIIAYTPRGHKG
ncbi:helix-turn-helix domain-containing protein [Ktedonobacter racemifer]|uniref:Helix-turn-helix domain-containing protein n=1 Tax=Ktedonobacter racemifer DSM 44963 TaxID=485913 RepID=D6U555_KTERA|nr:hypothetical protein Krac_2371 [Ktedonobacter racemifer DSM 44963]